MDPTIADVVAIKLQVWAREMWVRFGGDGVAVYLVGSCLTSEAPRDCDVSIVVPDALFARRYGGLEGDWRAHPRMEVHPAQRRAMRECGKLVMRLSIELASILPPDLKVMSEAEQERNHAGGARRRLDGMA